MNREAYFPLRPRHTEERLKAFEDWWDAHGRTFDEGERKELAELAFSGGIVDQEAWTVCGPSFDAARLRCGRSLRLSCALLAVMLAITFSFSQLLIYRFRQTVARQNNALAALVEAERVQGEAIQRGRAAVDRANAALAVCGCALPPSSDGKDSSFIHLPPDGKCPAGYARRKAFFTEPGGTKLDACENPEGDGSIDVLAPGESVEMQIDAAPPPDKNRKS